MKRENGKLKTKRKVLDRWKNEEKKIFLNAFKYKYSIFK